MDLAVSWVFLVAGTLASMSRVEQARGAITRDELIVRSRKDMTGRSLEETRGLGPDLSSGSLWSLRPIGNHPGE